MRVYTGITLAMFFWSISYIWTKIVFRSYAPITTIFIRLIIGSLFLYIFGRMTKRLQQIQRSDFTFFAALSFVQPFLYFLCESYSLTFVSPTVAAVIISTIPLLSPIGAYYFFHEKISVLNILGIIISFMGVILVVMNKDFSFSASPTGVLLLFLAVITGIVYTLLLKKLSFKYSGLTIVTYQNILGILWFLPLFLAVDLGKFLKVVPTWDVIYSLLLLGFLPTSLAYIFYTYAVKNLGISRASIYANMIPVFTASLAWVMLDDPPSLRTIIGIGVVIVGLTAAQTRWKNKKGAM